MEYSAVVVIGNGFDLNLGLKTSYADFIASDFFDSLIESGNELCKYLKNKQSLQNWIDIENELKTYSYQEYKNYDRKPFRQEYQQLCKALCNYLNNLDSSQIDKASKVYKIVTEEFKNVLVINFNYTDSIDYILSESKINHEVLRVHGRAKDNQIVFGVEDNADINKNDVFLKKSTCLWNEMIDIKQKLSTVSTVIFLGYSLGETDHHYFSDFFSDLLFRNSFKQEPKDIIVSYYGEDSYFDILKQIDTLSRNKISTLRSVNHFDMLDLSK